MVQTRHSIALRAGRVGCIAALTGLLAGTGCVGQPNAVEVVEPMQRPINLRAFLNGHLDAGARRIVIPPGRYRLTPENREHLRLSGLRDVEIIADGVELVCPETTRALTVEDCRNVRIRGLTIDYDPLPFTQGHITALSEDKRDIDVELFEGYPTEGIVARKFEIFDPETGLLRCHTYHSITVEQTGPRTVRVHKTRPYDPAQQTEQVGDIIVIAASHAPNGSIPHTVYCANNVDVTLEDVTVFASPVFGFMENDCSGTHYLRCRIDRRPPESDPVERTCRRFRSLNADAFHSNGATVGPRIEGCTARFQGDDCVNIHGDYHIVASQDDATLRVLAKRELDIGVGDSVELVSFSGVRHPDARVIEVSPDRELTDSDRELIERLRLLRPQTVRRAHTMVLDRETALEPGSVIASMSRMGNGFAVLDNDFGHIRSRGILIKASNGVVQGNRLTGCWGEAIKVAPEFNWLESGSSNTVTIADNTISGSRTVAIAVYAFGGNGEMAPAGAHRGITITGNRIAQSPLPGILVTSTAGLVLSDNTLELDPAIEIARWQIHRFGLEERTPIVRLNCAP